MRTAELAQQLAARHPIITALQKKRAPPAKGPKTPTWGFVAQHYKWALDRLFEVEQQTHAVIVEDDMEFSVDFLKLFSDTAWLLDRDPTLMCVSSWNDNSRLHLGTDPALLFRTSHFPGLGWMMRRETYLKELQAGWPSTSHWDNWLRANIRGRDCVSPSLPRNRNFGVTGSSMNRQAFKKEMANMDFYSGSARVDFGNVSYLLRDEYSARMQQLLARAERIDSPGLKPRNAPSGMVYLLLYGDAKTFNLYATYFRIWSHPRSHFEYLQMVEQDGDLFLIADVRFCPLLPDYLRIRPNPATTAVTASRGQTCRAACAAQPGGLVCSAADFPWLNDCAVLRQHFACEKGCIMEKGQDIPSYVSGTIPTKGFCVTKGHNEPSTCDGRHGSTSRLCPCVPHTGVEEEQEQQETTVVETFSPMGMRF